MIVEASKFNRIAILPLDDNCSNEENETKSPQKYQRNRDQLGEKIVGGIKHITLLDTGWMFELAWLGRDKIDGNQDMNGKIGASENGRRTKI